jgi:hypothetical protein
MKSKSQSISSVLAFATVMLVVTAVSAQLAGSGPEINWYTIDGGGGTSTGGSFSLSGTIGQPDAGGPMTGGGPGGFSLTGGFWPGAEPINDCPPDTNNDNAVNVTDLLAVIGAWGTCAGCPADINDDGFVNVTDLLAVIGAWGPCP